jgi:hypothetical protein
LHWLFTSDSTIANIDHVTNIGVKSLQITMHCPYVLVIYLKGQMLESIIKIRSHFMWMFSCLHSSKDLNAQKLSTMKFELCSKYMLYISPWQTLITTTRLHINTSHICANLIRACINSNSGKIHASPNKICKSHKCS